MSTVRFNAIADHVMMAVPSGEHYARFVQFTVQGDMIKVDGEIIREIQGLQVKTLAYELDVIEIHPSWSFNILQVSEGRGYEVAFSTDAPPSKCLLPALTVSRVVEGKTHDTVMCGEAKRPDLGFMSAHLLKANQTFKVGDVAYFSIIPLNVDISKVKEAPKTIQVLEDKAPLVIEQLR